MMAFVIVVALAGNVLQSDAYDGTPTFAKTPSFEEWSAAFNKAVVPERRKTFAANLAMITKHNSAHDRGAFLVLRCPLQEHPTPYPPAHAARLHYTPQSCWSRRDVIGRGFGSQPGAGLSSELRERMPFSSYTGAARRTGIMAPLACSSLATRFPRSNHQSPTPISHLPSPISHLPSPISHLPQFPFPPAAAAGGAGGAAAFCTLSGRGTVTLPFSSGGRGAVHTHATRSPHTHGQWRWGQKTLEQYQYLGVKMVVFGHASGRRFGGGDGLVSG